MPRRKLGANGRRLIRSVYGSKIWAEDELRSHPAR